MAMTAPTQTFNGGSSSPTLRLAQEPNPFETSFGVNPTDIDAIEYPRGVGGRKRKPTLGMDPKKIQFWSETDKCRLRKKQRLETTQLKRSVLNHQNMQLEALAQDLRFQCGQLRSLIASHVNCPVFQRLSATYPHQLLPQLNLPMPTLPY
ncbi:Transcription factor hy5 [Massospora cicadina]|nr:Transcription factor hy5 [Massospora cicadina]